MYPSKQSKYYIIVSCCLPFPSILYPHSPTKVRRWADGKCAQDSQGLHEASKVVGVKIGFLPVLSISLPMAKAGQPPAEVEGEALPEGGQKIQERSLAPRAECWSIKAVAEDGCWTLSQNCKIFPGPILEIQSFHSQRLRKRHSARRVLLLLRRYSARPIPPTQQGQNLGSPKGPTKEQTHPRLFL